MNYFIDSIKSFFILLVKSFFVNSSHPYILFHFFNIIQVFF